MGRLRSFFAAHFGALPPIFWWLWTGALVSALATFVFPFLALFLSARGMPLSQVGLTVSLFGAGSVLAGPLGGWFADRAGRRPTLLIALTGAGLITAALAFLHAPLVIAAFVFLFGLSINAARPAILATVADVVPADSRLRAYGLSYWANNVGAAVSLVLGGLLAAQGWALLFLADAATTVAFAAVAFFRVPETHPARAEGAPPAAPDGGWPEVLADRSLVTLLLVDLGFVVTFCQFQVTAPVDMAAHGLSPAAFGRVMAVNGVLIALLQPFAARLTRGLDSGAALSLGAALVGLGYGAYALCSVEWQYGLATALWTLGEILSLPTIGALVAGLAPDALRGRYQGLYGLTFGAGMTLSPVLGSAFMERFGARSLWAACLLLSILVGAFHLAIAGPRRRRLHAHLKEQA